MKEQIAYYPTPIEIVQLMISLSNNKNKNVLEAGFGQGAFFDELINNSEHKTLTGIELDTTFFNEQNNKIKNLNNTFLYNEDYLNHKFNSKFDLIIGNPPYITNDNLHPLIKTRIKELTGSGEGNIYYAFILKSIELLEENGELIYILPYDFFFNTYAKQLREKMIEEGSFELIIDLGDLNIFKNAAPETIIFKWKKNKNKNNIDVYKYINKDSYTNVIPSLTDILKTKILTNTHFEHFTIKHFNESDKIWALSNFNEYKNTQSLSKLAKVGVGIVNGSEEIFKLDNKDILLFSQDEIDIFVRTFIKAKNVQNNTIKEIENNKYLFISKEFKTEKDFFDYPNVWNYLFKNKEVLSKRYISKTSNWWNYLAIRNKLLMDENLDRFKIIVPNMTRKTENWFSITNLPYYIAGDTLMIKGNSKKDTFLLFGILNSQYFNLFYKEKGAKKGKRIIFNQKVLNEINIPKFNTTTNDFIVNEVDNMIKNNNFDFDLINNIIKKELIDILPHG